VRVYVPLDQRIKVKRAGEFERVARVRERRLFPEDLAAVAGDAVMTFRASMTGEVDRAACLADAHALWSMWAGYLDEPSGLRLRAWLSARGVPLTALHSSGHASVPDLRRLAAVVSATRVVPLHTRHPERYGELLANVDRRADGEWWTV
jgi:ribonuclease J